MKKILIVFSIVLALLLSACGKEEVPSTTPAPITQATQPADVSMKPIVTQPPAESEPAPVPTQTPTEQILPHVITESGEIKNVKMKLEGLTAAELHVKQLDQSFIVTDPETLRELEAALSVEEEFPFFASVRGEWNIVSDIESANPLYLYFADGSARVVYTMGDGSSGTTIWYGCAFKSSKSIFDMFGVPLEAAGYTYNVDGTTTVTTYATVNLPGPEVKVVQEEHHTVYSPDGRVLSISGPNTSFVDGPFLKEYKYDESNRLISMVQSSGGTVLESMIYEYNEFGSLSKYTVYDANGNWTRRYEYSYDEQGRMIAAMDYYAVGTQGAGTYFWYDGNGEQHSYTYERDGSIYGEAPPDGPIRK